MPAPDLSSSLVRAGEQWKTPTHSDTVLSWNYNEGRQRLLNLYRKGKSKQWDAMDRIPWDASTDRERVAGMPPQSIAIFGSAVWTKMSAREQAELAQHYEAWRFSQFLHGEQGALVCAARLVQTVPDLDAKFYAATQVMDEARHVEAFGAYVKRQLQLEYPINRSLQELLGSALADSRWDFTYLGLQVLIEGMALAAFGYVRNTTTDPVAASLIAYVMEDEARHVAFGRLVLEDYYRELSESELREREEFVVEGCYLMRDRFGAVEVFERLGLPLEECRRHLEVSPQAQMFRRMLFTRIVPIIKSVGLWGDRVRKAFEDMGVLHLSEADVDALVEDDESFARKLDERKRQVEETVALGMTEPVAEAQ